MTQGFILEFGDADKDPGYYAQTLFGQGGVSAGKLKLLLCGLRTSTGTLTRDTGFQRVLNLDEAEVLSGAGSELYRMARAAFRTATNCEVWLCTPTPAGGAAAATATITIDGTWTVGGQWRYRICGDEVSDGIASTDTVQAVAEGIRDYINARTYLPVTAAAAAGAGTTWVVTLTAKDAGVRSTDYTIVQVTDELPSGLTSALAGGTALTNGGKRFTGGSGVETMTTLLASEFPKYFERVAFAQRDATSIAAWETQVDLKAGPFEQRLQHCIGGFNSAAQATVTSIAQTTLNDPRFQVLWMKNGETMPQEMAAQIAARRASLEEDSPNQGYDDYELVGIRAHTDGTASVDADILDHAARVAALDAGITPVNTKNGRTIIVRSITTRSLTDTAATDDRTVDTSESWVPDWVNRKFKTFYLEEFKPKNPYVRADFAAEERPPRQSGIATPRLWYSEASRKMLEWQDLGIVTEVNLSAATKIIAQFNSAARRIVSRIPVKTLPIHHQIELSVEQIPYPQQ